MASPVTLEVATHGKLMVPITPRGKVMVPLPTVSAVAERQSLVYPGSLTAKICFQRGKVMVQVTSVGRLWGRMTEESTAPAI
ncbi:hypothetical protein, partial [Sinomonas sp.]|uniref:hypothetical protein n=1 Tax=Sinomonas sp. TaxID=1914986 RepID=UPI002FDF8C2B